MIVISQPASGYQTLSHKDNSNIFSECRLDMQENPYAINHIPIDSQTILTFRDPEQRYPERYYFLVSLAYEYQCLFDIEWENIDQIEENDYTKAIVSYHQTGHFNFNDFKRMLQKMHEIPGCILKIVACVDLYSDLIRIRDLLAQTDRQVIFVSTGITGVVSRIIYRLLNSYGTYLCLGDLSTAENQISYEEYEKYHYDLFERDYMIGGIIGGKQVFHSRGLSYYNDLFFKNNFKAIYLPFYIENSDDFKLFVKAYRKQIYGFSITMPFKKNFSENIVNTWIPAEDLFINSDLAAYQQSLEILALPDESSVLILGSGAMAELFIIHFQFRYKIYLICRNQYRKEQLMQKYQIYEFENNKFYDLIVNCSSLGMKNESVFEYFDIPECRSIIDLVYTQGDTSLIKYADMKHIHRISGLQFWEMQAGLQEKLFIKRIQKIN